MEWFNQIFLEPLQYQFLQRAMIASVIVGITSGLVGTFIMLRKMAMIGDALSHAVLPGVIIGFIIAGKGQLALFTGAVISGIVTALLIGFVNRNSKVKEDTAIGVIFTGAFAFGILLVSQMKNVHIDLSSYLFGDILGVSSEDLILSGIIGIVVLLGIILFYKQLLVSSFDPTMAAVMGLSTGLIHYFLMGLLSMTIVASLQSVGVILVVAMLITPAATAYLLTDRLSKMLVLSAGIGVFTALVGLIGSYHLNFASGASMVVFATFVFLAALLFSPSQGVVIKFFRRRKAASENLSQDILKLIYKNSYDSAKARILDKVSVKDITQWAGADQNTIGKAIGNLKNKNLINKNESYISLTAEGEKKALRVIRSHRLWETYLTNKEVLGKNYIHSDAEEYEHLLTDEILDEIEESLNHPEYDPHGSPIPDKSDHNQTSGNKRKSGK
jgi:ABC-type Mn2+/Zn2+ transport system permease subunit/Mn-dependent DtxR family transcriptional regulator